MLVSLSFFTMMVISFTTFPVPLEALHQLHILLITDPTSDANGTTRAIEMAVEAVNNNSHLLSEYALNITQVNSKCDRKMALDVLHNSMFGFSDNNGNSLYEVAIIGAGCSLASEAVAAVSQYYNLIMVSYSSSSGVLDDREQFPYFFRTIPSDKDIVLGISEFIDYFNWSRVVIFTQDDERFKTATKDLSDLLHTNSNNNISTRNILLSDFGETREEFFPPDNRVFVLNMCPEYAKFIMCNASLQMLSQHRSVWIIHGWYKDQWWTQRSACADDLDRLLETWDQQTQWQEAWSTCSRNFSKFLSEQRVIVVSYNPSTRNEKSASFEATDEIAYFAYDAVLAVAHGLQQSNESNLHLFDPVNTSTENRDIGEAIRNSTEDVNFDGFSGPVSFENGRRVMKSVQIFQYRSTDSDLIMLKEVALINGIDTGNLSFGFLHGESVNTMWPEGVPPDGTPLTEIRSPFIWLVVISHVYAGSLIICAVCCTIFTFVFRKRRIIRLTSPNLNYLIGVGAVIFCTGVFFFSHPPVPTGVLSVYCGIRSWFAAIGYSLCFGTINTKMWRVYYIFHNPKPASKKKPLKDWHLFMIVMLFVAVDVAILTVVTPIKGARLEPALTDDREHSSLTNEDGVTVDYSVYLCDSKWKLIWLVALLGYKVVIQVIGVFLAFKIRKVKIKVLNDSKETAFTLYLSGIILAAVILITVAFSSYLNVYTAAYSIGICLSATVVLGMVYITKMVRLYKDPRGENVLTHITKDVGNTTGIVVTSGGHATTDADMKVMTLEKKVKELQTQLDKYEKHGKLKRPVTNGKHVQIAISSTEEKDED